MPQEHRPDYFRGPLDDQDDRNLGGTVFVSPGDTNISLLSLKSDAAPVVCALALNIDIDPGSVSEGGEDVAEDQYIYSAVRVRFDFGIGAATQTVIADVSRGTVIAVPMQTAKVTLDYIVQCPPWLKDQDVTSLKGLPVYRVTGGLAYSPTGHNENPSRFTEFVAIENTVDTNSPPTNVRRVPIPAFATGFSVLPANDGTCTVAIKGVSSQFPVQYDVTAPLTNVGFHLTENAVPIPNGAKYLDITNTRGDGGAFYGFVVFGLAT